MATDATSNGHGRLRSDHWNARSWHPHASLAPLDTTAAASVRHASTLRRELRRWLDEDVTEPVARDITLSAYEAIAEVLTQVDPLDSGPLRLQARLDGHRVHVTISHTGRRNVPPDLEQSQHRLSLIRALTDHASFHRDEHSITVHLTTNRESPTHE